ncbi:MAG: hypothetical protein ACRD03_10905 [Acidimicrobiales bacterium]
MAAMTEPAAEAAISAAAWALAPEGEAAKSVAADIQNSRGGLFNGLLADSSESLRGRADRR